jgi:zinc D-Ala-D-Ala carboxypeptidase
MNQISKHITLNEAIESPTALRMNIDNTPTSEVLSNMQYVAENLFEPIRKWYKKPIKINSFFRCVALNKAVKGSASSQHVKGEAIDISAGNKIENKKIFDYIVSSNLDFDQCINEYDFTWVHISLKKSGNRKQVLIIK